jgi:hypothetical protein
MKSYAESRYRTHPAAEATYYFPVLEVYNESGILVYHGDEAVTNATILQGFPASIRNLPAKEDAPRLESLLDQIPDFKPRVKEILGKKQLVLLSIGLDECGACKIQEDAIGDLENRLLKEQSVTILKIDIAHP